jgi:hypothetical protein
VLDDAVITALSAGWTCLESLHFTFSFGGGAAAGAGAPVRTAQRRVHSA